MTFIDGIHNFCDRWCERCEFSARCWVYAMEKDADAPGNRELENREFWEQMSEIFNETRAMIEDEAKKRGITWTEDQLEQIAREERRKQEAVEAHPLVQSARAYADRVDEWLSERSNMLTEKEESWREQIEMCIEPEVYKKKLARMRDVLEIIQWYQHQISIKLIRALFFRTGDEPVGEVDEKDARGSAKVALIGIDRSIGAWGWLHQVLPEAEDELLSIFVKLQHLRRDTEQQFPHARSFQRPGFDT